MRKLGLSNKILKKAMVLALTVSMASGAIPLNVYAEEPAEPEEIIIEVDPEPKQEITENSESVVIQEDDIQVDAVQDELQTIEVNEPVKKVEGSNGETGSDSGAGKQSIPKIPRGVYRDYGKT